MTNDQNENLYETSGVGSPEDFYRTKFVSDEILDARYFAPLNRFDIRFARTMWVYDNIRAGATVLDLGCGAGMLALVKRKGVTLVGVDISDECARAALHNGYDETHQCLLTGLPFDDAAFDYVVSLDVLGHVLFSEKDDVLREIHRVLKPDGVTMHGIECVDRTLQRDYAEMTPDELRRFVEIDGHVGLETEDEHVARFARFFKHVAHEPRYALCLSSEEFLKQADRYGLPFEEDFLDYLRGLSFHERRAFDMAMGYVFGKISDLNVKLPNSGLYVFLKASGIPLGKFYNDHRDRSALLSVAPMGAREQMCLDRNPSADFDDGWYEPDMIPPVARWMRGRAAVRFTSPAVTRFRMDVTTHMPDVNERPLGVEVLLDGKVHSAFALRRSGWIEVGSVVAETSEGTSSDEHVLELCADRTWRPRPGDSTNRDDRELSIAVCNIEVGFN